MSDTVSLFYKAKYNGVPARASIKGKEYQGYVLDAVFYYIGEHGITCMGISQTAEVKTFNVEHTN